MSHTDATNVMITAFVSSTPVACKIVNQNTTKTRITTLLLYLSTNLSVKAHVLSFMQMFVPDVPSSDL